MRGQLVCDNKKEEGEDGYRYRKGGESYKGNMRNFLSDGLCSVWVRKDHLLRIVVREGESEH